MARPRVADERSQAKEGSCEYTEYARAEKGQGVGLQRGGWKWGFKHITVKINFLRKRHRSLGLGRINDISDGIKTWDLGCGMLKVCLGQVN
jgi:hypothetical protein